MHASCRMTGDLPLRLDLLWVGWQTGRPSRSDTVATREWWGESVRFGVRATPPPPLCATMSATALTCQYGIVDVSHSQLQGAWRSPVMLNWRARNAAAVCNDVSDRPGMSTGIGDTYHSQLRSRALSCQYPSKYRAASACAAMRGLRVRADRGRTLGARMAIPCRRPQRRRRESKES
jgi:hypothetical protein